MDQINIDLEDKKPLPKSVNIQVDGKILNELSKQVSSHLFALGELMKNSYDAEATSINLTLDLQKNCLIIKDNGKGISTESISSLLHIAKSGKEYGREFSFNYNDETITRYTQGSKGLGLFCAFKFGNVVHWDTKFKEEVYSITVNKEHVVESSDISKIEFPLNKGSRTTQGTTITIELDSNNTDIEYIYNTLENSKNHKKLLNFFDGKYIDITLSLINKKGKKVFEPILKSIPKKTLDNELEIHKFFDILYSSKDNIIKYYHQKKLIQSIEFSKKNFTTDYELNLKINAYIFPQGFRGVKKINDIFHNYNGDLSPLVYINGVLFNNDKIFDPSITRKIKGDKSLPQLTGYVNIVCTNEGLQFNNERTDLIANSFNDRLKNDLNELNKFLQAEGKKLQTVLEYSKKPNDDNEKPNDDNEKPNDNNEKPNNDNEKPNDDNEKPNNDNEKPNDDNEKPNDDNEKPNDDISVGFKPFINFNNKSRKIKFKEESITIDLKDFFENAKDSQNNDISINEINISIDDIIISSTLIPPIDYSTTKVVKYSFYDKYAKDYIGNTFLCSKSFTLEYIKNNSAFSSNVSDNLLIEAIGYQEYQIKLKGVHRLIEQVNLLYADYKSYDMCLASSIRVIFDLTTYRYQQLAKDEINSTPLEKQVESIINKIINDDKHFTKVAALLDPRHKINKNTFDPGLFAQKVAISNLGSHTGSSHLTEETIKDISKYAGYYAQLVDAHCKIKGFIN